MTEKSPIKPDLSIRASDLRATMGLAASSFHRLMKRLDINPEAPAGARMRGSLLNIKAPDVRTLFEASGFTYPKIPKIIAFLMCKGGVGKTTTTLFVGQRLAAYGARVLLVDADPQGNLTSSFSLADYGVDIDEQTPILLNIISEKKKLKEILLPITPNLHLVPSTPFNANLDARIRDLYKNTSTPIRNALKPVLADYDFILFDCAPALNVTNSSIVSACSTVVLPVCPDSYSLMGLEQTFKEIKQIEEDFPRDNEEEPFKTLATRVLFTKYDAREITSARYLTHILNEHEDKRFSIAIRTCADVKNVLMKKEDLFLNNKSHAKEDYDELAKEILGVTNFFSKHPAKQQGERI